MLKNLFFGLVVLFPALTWSQSIQQAEEAIDKAARFFVEEVAVRGGYVYFYSEDLSRRLGEGVASPDQIWVQPPGTPTVGKAFLSAWRATGDRYYLDAALGAGQALIYGQLQSGGWQNCVDFDPGGKRLNLYRNGKGRGKNNSTLDDGITQSALQFLILLDEALQFKNTEVSESVRVGLEALLKAQFPNGAFPQVWTGPVSSKPKGVKGNYPDYDWKTEGRIKAYWDLYTLNDGLAGDVTATLLEAHRVYGDDALASAIRRLGDFLIDSQMPAPQQGWAQQYNYQMQPVWARKFEPPAVAGRESQDVMLALIRIYQFTKDSKYLDPVVPGVKYLESSLLGDGRLARYYELETNRPLYMNRKGDQYRLTYDDGNLPSHYGWKAESRIDYIKHAYRETAAGRPFPADPADRPASISDMLKQLDQDGRWLEVYHGERLIGQAKFKPGEKYISSEVFSNRLEALSNFILVQKKSF